MNDLLQNLLKLQTLEFGESATKNAKRVLPGWGARIRKRIWDITTGCAFAGRRG